MRMFYIVFSAWGLWYMLFGGITVLLRTQQSPPCISSLTGNFTGVFLASNEANLRFICHTLVRTVWILCFCKMKHLRLLQVFTLCPQSLPAVGLHAGGGKPLSTNSRWWGDAHSVVMSWTTHLLFWCSSTVVRHMNMKGKENRWLFLWGTGCPATTPRAAGGSSRLPALSARGSSCQLQLGLRMGCTF